MALPFLRLQCTVGLFAPKWRGYSLPTGYKTHEYTHPLVHYRYALLKKSATSGQRQTEVSATGSTNQRATEINYKRTWYKAAQGMNLMVSQKEEKPKHALRYLDQLDKDIKFSPAKVNDYGL
ncbi:hypothetical protein E8E11_003599 [Didymella keratinophila]|nr:hypothetical protein E8E11_003599 [Didymella keratinophila]